MEADSRTHFHRGRAKLRHLHFVYDSIYVGLSGERRRTLPFGSSLRLQRGHSRCSTRDRKRTIRMRSGSDSVVSRQYI